jgi:membrane protein
MKTDLNRETGRNTVLTHGVATKDPRDLFYGTGWRAYMAIVREASLRLWSDDAFGLAGNIAFRALLALFPFLIFTSSLTAFIGDRLMVDRLVEFLIGIVPQELVEPIVEEVKQVMTVQRGDVLSIGILLTIWFAVGGVDGVRVGLNRAYGTREKRSTSTLFAVQTAVVIVAGLAFVLVSYLLVLAPRISSRLHTIVPDFDPDSLTISVIRYPAAIIILMVALFVAHIYLPARRIAVAMIWPGVLCTLILWTLLAMAFSYYLQNFTSYVSYYAGLAGIVAALYFLYLAALVLIFGGEFNRALRIRHLARVMHDEDNPNLTSDR